MKVLSLEALSSPKGTQPSPKGTKGCSVYLHAGPRLLYVLRNLVLNSEQFCDFIFSLFIQQGLHNMC